MGVELLMANKQKGRTLPPVMSSEETRVKPPAEEEGDLPPEDSSWDHQSEERELMGVDEATPPLPRKIDPIPFDEGPDDATRPIRRKTGARPALEAPDDATRPIQRKTGARPALQDPDDATRPIQRKTSSRPALADDPDDATRPIQRKTSSRPALEDPDDATRPIQRKTGARPALSSRAGAKDDPALPWTPPDDELASLPTMAQSLPPIVQGLPQRELVSPPHGPPVLVPVTTEPHYIPQVPSIPVTTQPSYVPPPPPAPTPVFTAPNYVPAPPPVLTPIVTAPHLVPSPQPAAEPPPEGELRTTFSNKAALVADLVRATFSRKSYGPYRLRIDDPDGPSTAGGLLARQPISLVTSMDAAPSVVVGWVDVSKKEAQLRSYGVVVKRHQNRHLAALDITEAEYERFLNELVETLFYGGIKILVQVPDEQESSPAQGGQAQAQAQPKRAGRSFLGTLLLVVLTFSAGVATGVMRPEVFAPMIEQVKALFGQG
jgi:hypothetical protein